MYALVAAEVCTPYRTENPDEHLLPTHGCPGEQTVPHLPQLLASFVRFVVQPKLAFEHAPQPVKHIGLHAPEPQLVPVAFWDRHCTLHAPQLFISFAVEVSQPLARLVSQSP